MKKTQSIYTFTLLLIGLSLMLGCEKRDIDELQPLTFPTTGEVFIDDFTGDLQYAAFGGSDVTAFQVDNQVTFNNSRQSMRFAVPDADSPDGAFAGGVFFSTSGRDLSGYNALTFYIKASQPVSIGELGFGNDLGENKYVVTLPNLLVNTNWQKVILPIPDASKLVGEKGLLYFAAGPDPEEGRGYTFWIDEVKYENLSDLGSPTGIILEGQNQVISDAETGQILNIGGLQAKAILPNGINQVVNISPSYFVFSSSEPGTAGVDDKGAVSIIDAGTTTITATLNGEESEGSLEITSIGEPVGPEEVAPIPPARDAEDVISLYSNAYTNVPIGTWNARYLFSTVDEFFVQVEGDDVIRYKNLNFVGIEFFTPTVDASSMGVLHMDIWTPDPTNAPNEFKILLADLGANGAFGGDDDSNHEITIPSNQLSTGEWVSLDIPLSSFTGLTSRANLGQMVLSGTLPNIYMDNVYFYRTPVTPPTAAPVPTTPAEDVSFSIFSDSYENVAGTVLDPNWGQPQPGWAVEQTQIEGNNTLHYINFFYQGLLIGGEGNSIDIANADFLHIDYYSVNANALNVYLISTDGQERPFALNVPTSGWNSVDIPLSEFNGINFSAVKEFKFDGGSQTDDIFLDNIYFWDSPAPPVVPVVAAPTPTADAADVLSIFSDSYPTVPNPIDLAPYWGQQPQENWSVTQPSIAGNTALHYANFSYQGLDFAGSLQDVSTYDALHLNYYSANATTLRVFLISNPGPGAAEASFDLTVPTSGWNTAIIPLSDFTNVIGVLDLNNIGQFKFDGGDGNQDIFLDNIYFVRGGVCPAPPAGDFIVDGNFEANAGCWELFANQAGTSTTIVTNESNGGGTNSARIKTAQGGNPGIKQTRFGVGVIQPNTTYVVTFDIRSDAADPVANGSVLNAFTFSEAAEGSGTGAVQHALVQGDANVPSAWTTRTYTFTTAGNVEGGLSLLIELIGGGETTTGTVFIDNVSLRAQ